MGMLENGGNATWKYECETDLFGYWVSGRDKRQESDAEDEGNGP